MFVYLSQTRHALEKLLDWENSHLYSKLGLHWRLAKQRCDNSAMVEYVSSLSHNTHTLTNCSITSLFLHRLYWSSSFHGFRSIDLTNNKSPEENPNIFFLLIPVMLTVIVDRCLFFFSFHSS